MCVRLPQLRPVRARKSRVVAPLPARLARNQLWPVAVISRSGFPGSGSMKLRTILLAGSMLAIVAPAVPAVAGDNLLILAQQQPPPPEGTEKPAAKPQPKQPGAKEVPPARGQPPAGQPHGGQPPGQPGQRTQTPPAQAPGQRPAQMQQPPAAPPPAAQGQQAPAGQ